MKYSSTEGTTYLSSLIIYIWHHIVNAFRCSCSRGGEYWPAIEIQETVTLIIV